MHANKLIVQQIVHQNRRQSHPGQARAASRKHANRQAKRLELATTAEAMGITVTELVKQRALQTEDMRIKSMIAAETERQRVLIVRQTAPRRSWLDDFHDDDRRWKY